MHTSDQDGRSPDIVPLSDSESDSSDDMKLTCGKCSNVISPRKHAPQCASCGKYFHGCSCVQVARESWKKWGPSRRGLWNCPPCKEIADKKAPPKEKGTGKQSVPRTGSQSQQPTPMSQALAASASQTPPVSISGGRGSKRVCQSPDDVQTLSNVQLFSNLGLDIDMSVLEDDSLPTSTKNLNKMLLYLVREVSSINNKFEKLNAEVNQLKATVQVLTEENRMLKKQRKQSDEKHKIGDYQRRLLNDYSRVDNLVLHGGPKATTEEESFVLFHTVAAAYGIVLDPGDVSVCHPLPSKGSVNKQIIRFSKRGSKIKLFLASKKRRLTARLLGWTGVAEDKQDDPVFITEHLSPDTARLLAEAKKKLSVAANGPYTHVWCRQGRVLLRCEGDRGRPLEVCHFTDIAEIYNDAVRNGFVPRTASPNVEAMDQSPAMNGQAGIA